MGRSCRRRLQDALVGRSTGALLGKRAVAHKNDSSQLLVSTPLPRLG